MANLIFWYTPASPPRCSTAARNPAADLAAVEAAMENIRRIAPEWVVLISTVAVYPEPRGVDEDTPVRGDSMNVYGRNRRLLESWVEETFSRRLVVRLPAIYGPGLKKNFIYDYIHLIPALLSENKFLELEGQIPRLREFYSPRGDGFFRCRELAPAEDTELKVAFQAAGFTALRFTDSRSAYQFYPLRRLWEDIRRAEAAGLARVNLWSRPPSGPGSFIGSSGERNSATSFPRRPTATMCAPGSERLSAAETAM